MKISANIKFDIDKVYGFFYSLNPDATAINKSSMDYKKGRDNMKLDIMRAIMESKSSTKSFLQPGGFKDLKENNHIINNKKVDAGIRDLTLQDGEYIEENNPIKPYTWINTANRMITGKALIGVSANANAAHAIFQHADELRLIEGFQFNGFTYDNLNKTNVIGTKMTRTKVISQTLAAWVDNGNDPQAKYSNINRYTIDVAMALGLAGVDLKTIQFFLSQPIIEDFVKDYFNAGSDVKAERLVKQKYEESLGLKPGAFNFNLMNLKISNFNTEFLEENLTGYQQSQLLLETFFSYKRLSRPISNLVSATKIGEAGLGPSDSDNLFRLDMLEEDNFEGLTGATKLLNRTDLFPYHLTEVIRKGRELIIGDFDDDGNRIGSIRLPDRNRGAFAILRSMFRSFKPFTNLTVKEIEFVNKNYLDYLATAIDFFEFDQNLINDLPKKLSVAKKLGKYDNFLNRLNLDSDKKNNITYIVYTGISGQDKHVIDRIRDSWEAMFLDGTIIEEGYTMSDLAYDLVKYSYMMSGFRISPQSFSHLQPGNFYFDYLREFNDAMETIIGAVEKVNATDFGGTEFYSSAITNFYHQFIRNHYRSLNFIPVADIENKTNIRSHYIEKNQIKWISIGSESIDMMDKGGNPVDYIKVFHNGESRLFKLSSMKEEEPGKYSALYYPVPGLGTYKKKYKGGLTSGKMFTQYDYNNFNPSFEFKQNIVEEVDVKQSDNVKDSGLGDDNPLNDECNKK